MNSQAKQYAVTDFSECHVTNLRDIGGYKTRSGKTIKFNKILRSGELSTLSDSGVELLKKIGLKRVYDLREPCEYTAQPDRKIENVEYISLIKTPTNSEIGNLTLAATNPKNYFSQENLSTLGKPGEEMAKGYAEAATVYIEAFSTILHDLAEKEGTILFHCTGGKDRVGMTTSLILSVLGIDKETIMQDFLLSNIYHEKTKQMITQGFSGKLDKENLEKIYAIVGVTPEFINAFLASIEENYTSIENYIENILKIDQTSQEKIRAQFLD